MRDLPGPATCKKCRVVALTWKKLKCGHLLCLNCLQIGIDARQKEISELGKIKNLRKDKVLKNQRSSFIIADIS